MLGNTEQVLWLLWSEAISAHFPEDEGSHRGPLSTSGGYGLKASANGKMEYLPSLSFYLQTHTGGEWLSLGRIAPQSTALEYYPKPP